MSIDLRPGLGMWLAFAITCYLLSGSPALAHGFMPDRSYFENGMLHAATAWHLLIPAVGVAMAAAALNGRAALAAGALWVAGAGVGFALHGAMPEEGLDFLAPLLFVLAGLALLVPMRWGRFVLPVLLALSGLLAGITIYFDGPGDDDWLWYGIGALDVLILAGVGAWLVWRWNRASWSVVAQRIFGSWLVALGLMLGGLSVRLIMQARELGL